MTTRVAAAGALTLEPCRDSDFAWFLTGRGGRPGLRLPPGGVDTPEALVVVRSIHAAAGGDAAPPTWMMVVGDEVVGLCGRSRPDGDGLAEIGYSVAPERRGRGHATAAVALLALALLADPKVAAVVAVTTLTNTPSHRALERNGFVETGRETRPDDGPVILWRRDRDAPVSTTQG